MEAVIEDLEQIIEQAHYLTSVNFKADFMREKLDDMAATARRALEEAKHWQLVLAVFGHGEQD